MAGSIDDLSQSDKNNSLERSFALGQILLMEQTRDESRQRRIAPRQNAIAAFAAKLSALFARLRGGQEVYRPEKHYMRGTGPKSRMRGRAEGS
jgi:hypothetical protein